HQPQPLPAQRRGRAADAVQVRGVRRRADVRPIPQGAVEMSPATWLAVAALALAAAPALAAPVAAPAYQAPKNEYGQPDLQGVWTNATLTEFERPADYGDRLVMTPEEVAKVEGANAKAMAEGNAPTDPKLKVTDLPYDCGRGFKGVDCGYNSGWVDPGSTVMRVHGEPRTS